MQMVSKEQADARIQPTRTGPEGDPVGMNALDYFGRSSDRVLDDGAAGWVLELDNQSLAAHFHDVDQFQIFLPSPGATYQRIPIDSLIVQYSDAYATYGPLVGTTPPFRFITLRPKQSDVYAFMPSERERLLYRGRRHVHVKPELLTPENCPEPGETRTESIIELHEDGLEVQMITCGPGASTVVWPREPGTMGQFVYLAVGSAELAGATYGAESLGWQLPEDGPSEFRAGPDGCQIMVLKFPFPSTDSVHAESAHVGSTA
jgi:hypothetical protein